VKAVSLGEFADNAEELEDVTINLRAQGLAAASAVQNLRKLRRLELLTDEAVLSLIGQAPIDPLGVFGMLRQEGVWAFSAHDFCTVRVLAKKGNKPVALMRVDLLSDDVSFVVLRDAQLVERVTIPAQDLLEVGLKSGAPGVTLMLENHAKETVDEGMANA
jgi:hypothetical protein